MAEILLIGLILYIPFAGAIWIGTRLERQRNERLFKEAILSLRIGGRRRRR